MDKRKNDIRSYDWRESLTEMAAVLNQILIWCFGHFFNDFFIKLHLICTWERIYAWCFQLLLLIIISLNMLNRERNKKHFVSLHVKDMHAIQIVYRYAENIFFQFLLQLFSVECRIDLFNHSQCAMATETIQFRFMQLRSLYYSLFHIHLIFIMLMMRQNLSF